MKSLGSLNILLSSNKDVIHTLIIKKHIWFAVLINTIISLVSFQAAGQIILKGIVMTPDSIAISNANIYDVKTGHGATTNKQGVYFLNIIQEPTDINISHVGFETSIESINNRSVKVKNDTIHHTTILSWDIVELAQVEINADLTQLAYNKPKINVIDYVFYEEFLLLLIKEDKEFLLRLTNENSKTINDILIKKKPKKLFKDCLNNIHIIYQDSIFQVIFSNTNFKIGPSSSINDFNEILLPCIASTNNHLIFKENGLHNQSVLYYSIDIKDKKKKIIREIIDNEALNSTDDFYHQSIRSLGASRNIMGNISSEEKKKIREAQTNIWFYTSVLSNPIYDPLILLNDSIIIFHHEVDSIFVFNQAGELSRSFTMQYHNTNGWDEEIVVDVSNNGVYAKCLRRGFAYLLNVNMKDGSTINKYKIVSHLYPENLKIRDGYLYYIYTERINNNRNLFKQRLF